MAFEHDDLLESGVSIKVVGVGGGGKGAIAAFARSNARGAGFAADCVGEGL